MPKKTTSNEKKSSATTKLFRSMSISSRNKSALKDHSTGEDRRTLSGPESPDSERVSILLDQNADLMNERNEAMDDCSRTKAQHETTCSKLRDAEREIENLKVLLASSYRDEMNEMSKIERSKLDREIEKSKNVIYPSKVEQHETTIEANAVPLSSPSPCKECELLRDLRNKSVVEVIALRKYTQQLSEVLSQGDQGRRNFLNDFEKKLVSAQREKEIALEELAHVIDQRDQLVRERNKALEEWGRAAGKWDNTLDQVDSLMTELNQVKSERDELKNQAQRKESLLANLKEENGLLQEQVDVSRKERKNSVAGHEFVAKEKHENAETLRQVSTELSKAQQRCLEMDAKMTSLSEKAESYRKERDHAKEQWRQSVKERKRLHREIAVIVQTRDEAIQKCFSTAEQLDRLKEEHNQLLNRLAKTGLSARNSSELSIPCSLKNCKFCSDEASSSFELHDSPHAHMEGEEIRVTMEKDEPRGNISIGRVSCNGRSFIAVMDVSKSMQKSRNIRKYDEIVSINDVPMTDDDQNLVRSLLQEATALINMILRRPVTNCQMNFDLELRLPKKSKALGFECGLYVKEMKYGVVAEEQRTLDAGDYIVKINGKHLDKVIASALEKVTKKGGDKLKLNITRTIEASSCREVRTNGSNALVLRRTKHPTPTGDDNNRLSLISNDSSISVSSRFSGNSSMGSMSSYADSCLADSTSDICLSKHSSQIFLNDRSRIGFGIYSPTSEPRLDTSRLGDSPDERDEDGTCKSNPDDTDTDGSLQTIHCSSINRKSVSTSQLPVPRKKGAVAPLSRGKLCVTSVRSEEGGLNTVIRRPQTVNAVSTTGSRVIRLEKKPFNGLGLEIFGGNLLGIYVTELAEDSVLKAAGLKIGDRLLKVNSFDLTHATLDHATRTVKLLNTCSYLRIEAQHVSNYEEVLKVTPFDSLYVRTKHAYRAMAPDELSFTVGETLHVINTRANYDQARQSWKWVAQRARKDGNDVEEGLVPCMGSLPEHLDSSQTFQKFESESEELTSDDAVLTLKRGSTERKSLLQRYRKLRKRQSKDNIYTMDDNVNNNKVIFYEILSKFSD